MGVFILPRPIFTVTYVTRLPESQPKKAFPLVTAPSDDFKGDITQISLHNPIKQRSNGQLETGSHTVSAPQTSLYYLRRITMKIQRTLVLAAVATPMAAAFALSLRVNAAVRGHDDGKR